MPSQPSSSAAIFPGYEPPGAPRSDPDQTRWQRRGQDARARQAQPELPFVPPLFRRLRRLPLRQRGADAAYVLVAGATWVGGNLLAIMGALVALLLVLCGGDLDMFFLQLNNLTRRYVEADLGRRAAFQHDLAWAFTLGCIVLFAVRTPLFVKRVRRELREEVR